jgi:hypothetical protein
MRDSFRDLVAVVGRAIDGPTEEVQAFFAQGMLMNVSVALGLHGLDEPFARTLTEKHGGDGPAGETPSQADPGP